MGIIENMKRNASYKDSDVYHPGAFNPGLFELNKKKLKALRPQIFGLRLGQKNIDTWQNVYTQLNDGDIVRPGRCASWLLVESLCSVFFSTSYLRSCAGW